MIRGCSHFLVILLFLLPIIIFAQQPREEVTTNNTVQKRINHRKYKPKVKRYDRIYKKSTKNTLYGNPCAIEETHRMGFEYVPLSRCQGKSKMGIILNNTLVNVKLVFTRTPFWKLILNKRFEDCRIKSGDGIG